MKKNVISSVLYIYIYTDFDFIHLFHHRMEILDRNHILQLQLEPGESRYTSCH